MSTTINISMPTKMYKQAKKLVKEGKYHSISEVVRAGIRRVFYDADQITENGMAGWEEDQLLELASQPVKKTDIVLETEEDIHNYFRYLKKPKRNIKISKSYDKSDVRPRVRAVISGFSSK